MCPRTCILHIFISFWGDCRTKKLPTLFGSIKSIIMQSEGMLCGIVSFRVSKLLGSFSYLTTKVRLQVHITNFFSLLFSRHEAVLPSLVKGMSLIFNFSLSDMCASDASIFWFASPP